MWGIGIGLLLTISLILYAAVVTGKRSDQKIEELFQNKKADSKK